MEGSATPQRKQIAVRPTDETPAMMVARSPVREQNNLIDGKMTMETSKSFSSVASGTWNAPAKSSVVHSNFSGF